MRGIKTIVGTSEVDGWRRIRQLQRRAWLVALISVILVVPLVFLGMGGKSLARGTLVFLATYAIVFAILRYGSPSIAEAVLVPNRRTTQGQTETLPNGG